MSNQDFLSDLHCKATGIGSVPHRSIDQITGFIFNTFPDIPFWPQMINADPMERMMVQYTENLPCLKILDKNGMALYDRSDRKNELQAFYNNFYNKNLDHFKISDQFARGFYFLQNNLKNHQNKFVKGQVLGPITFLMSIKDSSGSSILSDTELCNSLIYGLGMKAVWQSEEIKKSGKSSIIFFDEPGMSAFGSDYLSLSRKQVNAIFKKLIYTVRENTDTIIGIHCCGNTEWDIPLDLDIDIISYDTYTYSDKFLSYHDKLYQFLERGGCVAWGIVPTTEFNANITFPVIEQKYHNILNFLKDKGIQRELILKRSLFTPACGTGTLSADIAEKIFSLTKEAAVKILP